ncbi:hypothetical protein [Veillonella caviae]|uniref:hypothetical protein n=1 Tax=Veillonella caviae TaxID=248316 RepID=UPI0023EFD6E1|nr:hypothetical protein [Veillonella caviae]MCI6406389.1 hypothetical protein [Veillonella caviae]MDD7291651.1 hypothetical protein [Veillonella caviae]MDY6224907.1 hypothetical protein [Veillonella caviae]
MNKSEKIIQFIIVICIAAIITGVGNIMDGKHLLGPSMMGVFVLAALATLGALISYLPVADKLPMVFWVSLVGVIASLPAMPGQEWIIKQTSQVTFLATTTPVLAYAGLSLGKDLGAFRRLSWRIVPVALAVTAGTFICAAAVAQFMLHLEGVI